MSLMQQQWKNARLLSWLLAILGLLLAGLFSSNRNPWMRGIGFTAGLACTHFGMQQRKLASRCDRILQTYEHWTDEQTLKALCTKRPDDREASATEAWQPALYDWRNAVDEGVGFIIAGNSGSAKTSVACWLGGLLTQVEPAQCLALDPHFNDIWAEQGIHAIGDIAEIEATVKRLLVELDSRCTRKQRRQPLGDPLIIFADEINACMERFKDPKWMQSALKRLGSEGRKFGMTLIAMNQSSTGDDLGISAQFRNNYVLILLGAAARGHAQQMGRDYMDFLKGTAYPCVVSGAVETAIAIHPTHSTYTQFKKKGNPPQNLIPLSQLPLTFLDSPPIRTRIQPRTESVQFGSESSDVNRLNRLYENSFSDSVQSAESPSPFTLLPPGEKLNRIIELQRQGLGQNAIILELWQAKPGANKAYQQALAEYRNIIAM